MTDLRSDEIGTEIPLAGIDDLSPRMRRVRFCMAAVTDRIESVNRMVKVNKRNSLVEICLDDKKVEIDSFLCISGQRLAIVLEVRAPV